MTFKEALGEFAQIAKEDIKYLFRAVGQACLFGVATTLICCIGGYSLWLSYSEVYLLTDLQGLQGILPPRWIMTTQTAPWIYHLIIPMFSVMIGFLAMSLVLWAKLFALVSKRYQ
jgi:hypothetical protein